MQFTRWLHSKLKRKKYVNKISHILTFLKHDYLGWPKISEKDALMKYRRVIVLSPHPDDEVFGMGGTLLHLKQFGALVRIVWLTNGSNSTRVSESLKVLDELNIEQDINVSFPSTDEHLLVCDGKKIISNHIKEFRPDLICTPSVFDCHEDHVRLIISLSDAIRELNWYGDVMQYEVWSTLITNYVVDISDVIDQKSNLMRIYESQTNDNTILCYIERIIALNKYRGLCSGTNFAEAFCLTNAKEFMKMVNS